MLDIRPIKRLLTILQNIARIVKSMESYLAVSNLNSKKTTTLTTLYLLT